MKIEFIPSVKTVRTMKKIHRLRRKGIFWDDVAKEMNYKKRYCQALYKYYLDEIFKKEKKV